jgi:hypothetical protein
MERKKWGKPIALKIQINTGPRAAGRENLRNNASRNPNAS